MESHPIIKFIVIAMLVMIVGALGSAFLTLFRGRDGGTAGVKALTIRVGLSIALFVFLMVLYALGIIEPRGG
jgi:Protein of unknown function (DUF2909)